MFTAENPEEFTIARTIHCNTHTQAKATGWCIMGCYVENNFWILKNKLLLKIIV